MTKSNTYLDELFEKTRKEQPIASFEETKLRLSNSISSISTGAISSLLSKFKSLIVSVSFLTILTLTMVLVYIHDPLRENRIESSKNVPAKVRTQPSDLQAEKQVTSKLNNDIKTSPSSTSYQGIIQNNIAKRPGSSNLAKESALEKYPELSAIPQLKTEVLSAKHLTLPSVKSIPIITFEPKELQAKAVEFIINERTSTKKLASISYQARQAGINYTYVVDQKYQLIREFNVDMSIPDTNLVSTIQVSVPNNGRFEVKFGWFVGADGKAITLSDNIFVQEAPAKHPLHLTQARNFGEIYKNEGINYLERNFDSLMKETKVKGSKDQLLNTTGYLFLKQRAFVEAIEIFKLNTRLFPKEANPWDSLGEALYQYGDKENALIAFQRALSLNPGLSSSQRWVKKIKVEK